MNQGAFHVKICDNAYKGTNLIISRESIMDIVLNRMKCAEEDFAGDCRKVEVVQARHTYFSLCRKYTNDKLIEIASLSGFRDHSTVIHGSNSADDRLLYDDDFKKMYKNIEAELKGEALPYNYDDIHIHRSTKTDRERTAYRMQKRAIRKKKKEAEIIKVEEGYKEQLNIERNPTGLFHDYSYISRHS